MVTNALNIAAVILLVFSCNLKTEQTILDSFAPKIVDANVDVIHRDSLAPPKVIPAGKPQVVKAGNPKVVLSHSNVHPAGTPKMVAAGNPKKKGA